MIAHRVDHRNNRFNAVVRMQQQQRQVRKSRAGCSDHLRIRLVCAHRRHSREGKLRHAVHICELQRRPADGSQALLAQLEAAQYNRAVRT
jgi:hypothetical protein